jgi:hypothetical protein
MNTNGGLVTSTIEIVIERDDKTGAIYVKGNYKDLPIDMLYEAMKFMIGNMLSTSEHITDPVTRKVSIEMMRSCQYVIKGGEAALAEARMRAQKQG